MKLNEKIGKSLDLLSSLKDDTNDAINTTPYILKRLSEFTDGELGDLVSNLEEVRDEVEQLEKDFEKIKENIEELQFTNEE